MNDNVEKRVFVTQYSDHLNFREAEHFGTVTFLSEKEYRAEPAMASVNDRIRDEITNGLSNYIAGTDYILLTGSPVPSVIAGAVISKLPGTHNLLKWNNQRRSYDLVKIRTIK